MNRDELIEQAASLLVEHPSVPNFAAQAAGDVFAMRCPTCGADDIAGPNSPAHARHQAQALADAGLLATPPDESWAALMRLLDKHWPEDLFPTLHDDPDRDTGPRIVSLLRWVGNLSNWTPVEEPPCS